MEVVNLHDIQKPIFPSCVLTLGNFDGVHLGHRALFRKLLGKSRDMSCPSVVCTFVPHPLKVIRPDRAPLLINTLEEKRRLIAASGIDYLIEIPFTTEFSELTPNDFVVNVLQDKLNVAYVYIGYDYAFGRQRSGTPEFLKACGEQYGFEVEVLPPVGDGLEVYSSTRVRTLVGAGRVAEVKGLLGRHYTLEGYVGHGDRRGRELGYPTANLCTDKELLPLAGIYAVKARVGNCLFDAVVNIGTRPTFGAGDTTIEVHLLDFDRSIYGESVRIYFFDRIRDEEKFTNVADLIKAIECDVVKARSLLAGLKILEYNEYFNS